VRRPVVRRAVPRRPISCCAVAVRSRFRTRLGSGFGLGRAVVNYAVVNNAAVDHAAGDYAAVNHAAIEHFVLRSSNDDPSRGVDPSELADERRDDGRVEHRY